MLDGLEDEQFEQYLEDKPRLVPLFKIDIIKATNSYAKTTKAEEELQQLEPKVVTKISRAQKAFEQEMDIVVHQVLDIRGDQLRNSRGSTSSQQSKRTAKSGQNDYDRVVEE